MPEAQDIFRVAVTGGREFSDRAAVFAALDRVHARKRVTLLVHGNARGADRLAKAWADARRVPQKPFPARWKELGHAAGPARNQEMVDHGLDALVAFPGNVGTADMTRRCKDAGVTVWAPFNRRKT